MAATANTVYSYPNNPRVWKAAIAAQYTGVELGEAADFQMGTTNKTPEFLQLNPLGKVPTLETADGGIFESNSIAKFVAKSGTDAGLVGSSVYEEAVIDSWCTMSITEIDLPAGAWLYPILGYIPYNKAGTKQAKADVKKILQVLDNHLTTKTYLVGEQVTLADIVVFCSLLPLYKMVLEPQFKARYVNTNRWFDTILNQPQVQAVVTDFAYCEKMMQPDFAKINAAKNANKKKGKKGGNNNNDNNAPKKAKKKDWTKSLPATSFVLDTFKKEYSNKDTRTEAIPFLWENYDPAGYSWWKIEYKYNNELKQAFKASNLVSGFHQRTPGSLRKNAFASVLIIEGEENFEIEGVWMVRGDVLPEPLTENVDYEHYNFTKIDAEADRDMINDYLAWDGATFEGKTVADGKVYK